LTGSVLSLCLAVGAPYGNMVIMKYGGPVLFRRAKPFFLGLIVGQFAITGVWLVIDYLTGMTDDAVFWI